MPTAALPRYPADYKPTVYIAMDDVVILDMKEIKSMVKSNDAIVLSGHSPNNGFTADAFWKADKEEKRRLGEGYVVDMKGMEAAVDEKGWVVCDLNASLCRIMALAIG